MGKKRIIFRVDGYKELGMGHIYNCYTIAEAMPQFEHLFVLKERSDTGREKLDELKMPYITIKTQNDLEKVIDDFCPDIWVNDCLDTTEKYVRWLKSRVRRVITIEDKGPGQYVADAAINAVYGDDEVHGHIYNNWRYVCLRKEFQECTFNEFRTEVRNVILMFGGTDPSNYNKLLYKIVDEISSKYNSISFSFITGIGYDNVSNGVISVPEKNIFVYPNVDRVTDYMKDADLAIASQGRAVFELAAMGIPAIILSQNEREQTHTFAQMDHGFLNLGLKDVSASLVGNTLDWLINTPPIRKNMYDLMVRLPLREGRRRVIDIILGENEDGL